MLAAGAEFNLRYAFAIDADCSSKSEFIGPNQIETLFGIGDAILLLAQVDARECLQLVHRDMHGP